MDGGCRKVWASLRFAEVPAYGVIGRNAGKVSVRKAVGTPLRQLPTRYSLQRDDGRGEKVIAPHNPQLVLYIGVADVVVSAETHRTVLSGGRCEAVPMLVGLHADGGSGVSACAVQPPFCVGGFPCTCLTCRCRLSPTPALCYRLSVSV